MMMMMMMMMVMVFAAFADPDVILKSLKISSNHLPKRAPNLHKLMVSVHLLSPLLLLRDCRGHHCVASDWPQMSPRQLIQIKVYLPVFVYMGIYLRFKLLGWFQHFVTQWRSFPSFEVEFSVMHNSEKHS